MDPFLTPQTVPFGGPFGVRVFSSPLLQLACLAVKGGHRQATGSGGLAQSHGFGPPCPVEAVEILQQRAGRPAEANPSGLGRGDALRLALAEVGPLVLRHEGEDLQDMVP